jgi:hypothetical protein
MMASRYIYMLDEGKGIFTNFLQRLPFSSFQPGSRKVRFKIPNSYVTEGQSPRKTFDLGTINLETIFADEERELIVSKKRRHLRSHHHRLHEKFNFFAHF